LAWSVLYIYWDNSKVSEKVALLEWRHTIMGRFITNLIGSLLLLGLVADVGLAQGFRRGSMMRPATPMHTRFGFQQSSPFNNVFATPFNNGFITTSGALVRATPGTFNPSTGAFMPSTNSAFVLARRGGFEPVNGTFTPSATGDFVLKVRETFNPNMGSFTPSATGNFVVRERGTFAPTTGSFVQSTTGSVNLATGAFVPSATGAFTLASRGDFVASKGTFVPSPFGKFALTTKEAFDPNTGNLVPSATGTFLFQLRGDFVPSTSTSQATATAGTFRQTRSFLDSVLLNNLFLANSRGLSNPLSNPNLASPFNTFGMPNAFQSALFNPYAAGYVPPAYSYGSYASAPYSAAGYGGYPYAAPYAGGYGSSSYGAPNAHMNPYAQGYASAQPNSGIPAYAPSASQTKQQSVLAALGIPNEDGAVTWPLAFRLMSPDKKRELLDPLESQLKVAATQAASDKANPAVLKQAKQNVEDLHKWLLPRRLDLAEGTYRDAVRFLAKLDNALTTIR
jgi:hypothetical protein